MRSAAVFDFVSATDQHRKKKTAFDSVISAGAARSGISEVAKSVEGTSRYMDSSVPPLT